MIVTRRSCSGTRWFIIFPAIALTIFGFFRWKKTKGGRKKWDRSS